MDQHLPILKYRGIIIAIVAIFGFVATYGFHAYKAYSQGENPSQLLQIYQTGPTPVRIPAPSAVLGEMIDTNAVAEEAIPSSEETTPLPAEPAEREVLGTVTLLGPPINVVPIDPKGSIVIPEIGVNSPIVFDVSVSNKVEYEKALEKGVAHAIGTAKPTTENSNSYLFAHSTANEQNIARYAAIFTKLNQLKDGARVILFYDNKRYDYQLFRSEIVGKFDTNVLTRSYDFPSVTLQTCDPPGVPQNRLIVTAKLISVYDQ
jgi:sortase A